MKEKVKQIYSSFDAIRKKYNAEYEDQIELEEITKKVKGER